MRDPDSGDQPMEEGTKRGGVWQRVPRSLRLGVAVVLVGLGVTLLTGWPLGCFSCVMMEVALLAMAVASVAALVRRENRRRPHLWRHLGSLVAAVGLLYVVTLGPGNYLSLIVLRTRGRVAMTGGRDQLQAWAVEVLAKPREQMQEDGSGWLVPREEWSEQVRHLGGGVRIDPLLEGGRNAVRLCYGGGFFHWYIVVGPPGSAPDPNLVKERPFDAWYRWGDGVYGWFPEN